MKRFFRMGIEGFAALAILLVASACRAADPGPIATIRIGTTTSEVNSLILIAEDQGYFASNGLEVDHKIYSSGVAALDGLLTGEVDLATGSEFAFAGHVLSQYNIRTIGSISRSSIEYLVGRLDRGVHDIADLEGKRIGVPLGSRPEFALDRFLYFRGIETSQVTLVDVRVDASVEALVDGNVDAVAAWQPYIDQIKAQMKDQVVVWSVQEDQPSYTLLMSRAEWTGENEALVIRTLRSLIQAENYVVDQPEAARTLIQEKLGYDADYVASVWPDYRFSVGLDQALIAAMEDQARWIIDHNLTGESETPNFVNYVYVRGLEAVKPEAVTIIR